MSPPPNFPAFLASPEKRQQEQGGGARQPLSGRAHGARAWGKGARGARGRPRGQGWPWLPLGRAGGGGCPHPTAGLLLEAPPGHTGAAGGGDPVQVPVQSPATEPHTGAPHGGAAWPPGRWQGGRGRLGCDHQERLRPPRPPPPPPGARPSGSHSASREDRASSWFCRAQCPSGPGEDPAGVAGTTTQPWGSRKPEGAHDTCVWDIGGAGVPQGLAFSPGTCQAREDLVGEVLPPLWCPPRPPAPAPGAGPAEWHGRACLGTPLLPRKGSGQALLALRRRTPCPVSGAQVHKL